MQSIGKPYLTWLNSNTTPKGAFTFIIDFKKRSSSVILCSVFDEWKTKHNSNVKVDITLNKVTPVVTDGLFRMHESLDLSYVKKLDYTT